MPSPLQHRSPWPDTCVDHRSDGQKTDLGSQWRQGYRPGVIVVWDQDNYDPPGSAPGQGRSNGHVRTHMRGFSRAPPTSRTTVGRALCGNSPGPRRGGYGRAVCGRSSDGLPSSTGYVETVGSRWVTSNHGWCLVRYWWLPDQSAVRLSQSSELGAARVGAAVTGRWRSRGAGACRGRLA